MKNITKLVVFTFIMITMIVKGNAQTSTGLIAIKSKLHEQTPSDTKAIIDSLHYDGENYNGVGTSAPLTIGAYAFFPATSTSAHNIAGNYITSVKLFIQDSSDVASATVKIYSDTGVTLLATQAFTPVSGWNKIALTPSFAIPASDMYIGYELNTTGGTPVGIDTATAPVPNGNWTFYQGSWKHLNEIEAGLTGTWNIRAMVNESSLNNINEAIKEWASIFPNPVNNLLYIATNQIPDVEIISLAGEKIASYKGVNVVDVANLAEGTYLVKVITKTNISTKKINIVR